MKRFNVRVYGVLIKEGSLLVSDELILGKKITKFPGGGLEFGEGIAECIVREFKEELNLAIQVKRHLYTTDFFVASAFNPNSQVISVYYEVEPLAELKIATSHRKFDFSEKKEGAQAFRWVQISLLKENDFTFVIDQRMVSVIKTNF